MKTGDRVAGSPLASMVDDDASMRPAPTRRLIIRREYADALMKAGPADRSRCDRDQARATRSALAPRRLPDAGHGQTRPPERTGPRGGPLRLERRPTLRPGARQPRKALRPGSGHGAAARADSESIRDEKVKVLKAIAPLEPKDLVRGQFRGYRAEKGVSPQSQVETFAALRLWIESWRWQGVPFYIRAGKCLPVTCAEIVIRLRQPPTMYQGFELTPNALRWRISPEITFAFGLNVPVPGQERVV